MAGIYNPDSDGGWIALARSARFHPVVGMGQPVKPADPQRGAYSKFEAWVDLIMMACRAPADWMNKGRQVELQTGQLTGGLSWLGDRWNWTVKQVRVFVEKLLAHGMAAKSEPETKSNHVDSGGQTSAEAGSKQGKQKSNMAQTLSICNYSTYQVTADIDEGSKGQAKGKRGASEGHDSRTREQDRSPIGDSSPKQGDMLPAAPAVEPKPARKSKASVPEVYSKSFEFFWAKYPRREGKAAAFKSWDRLTLDQ